MRQLVKIITHICLAIKMANKSLTGLDTEVGLEKKYTVHVNFLDALNSGYKLPHFFH